MPESHVWTTSNQDSVPNQVDEKVSYAYLHLGAPMSPTPPRGGVLKKPHPGSDIENLGVVKLGSST